ncbi:MAG: DedA family protein [Frankia sp.]
MISGTVSSTIAVSWLSPSSLVSSFGTIGLMAIIFAETGLLIGFFLPGDSLLFLAGAYCATRAGGNAPHLSLGPVLVGVSIAAVLGAQVGYLIGGQVGPALFRREDSRLFKQAHVVRAQEVLAEYGEGKAIFLARFIPVVRTFLNPVCGAIGVSPRIFTRWNVAGGLVWALGVTLLGYALGRSVNIDHYILPITAVIVVLSAIPVAREWRRQRQA